MPDILDDQKLIWTFPVTTAIRSHWARTLGMVAVTAGLVALDPHDTPYFRRTKRFNQFNQLFSGSNIAVGTPVVPLSFYALALTRKDTRGKNTVPQVGEAVADAEILTTAMKDVDRRLRPVDIPPDGDFSESWFRGFGSLIRGRGGFPSGYTIAAFSVATVFAVRYHQDRWVPWVAYGLAGLVGLSRITLQSHFPSDVFAGAALGCLIGHNLVLAQR